MNSVETAEEEEEEEEEAADPLISDMFGEEVTCGGGRKVRD